MRMFNRYLVNTQPVGLFTPKLLLLPLLLLLLLHTLHPLVVSESVDGALV